MGQRLAIDVPADAANWALRRAEVSPSDRAAGVTISAKAEAQWIRGTIASPTSREVDWSIAFWDRPRKIK